MDGWLHLLHISALNEKPEQLFNGARNISKELVSIHYISIYIYILINIITSQQFNKTKERKKTKLKKRQRKKKVK